MQHITNISKTSRHCLLGVFDGNTEKCKAPETVQILGTDRKESFPNESRLLVWTLEEANTAPVQVVEPDTRTR